MAMTMVVADKLHPEAAGAGSAVLSLMTENELAVGYHCLEAHVISSDDAPDKDQLPDEGKGALMDNAVCRITSPGTSVSVNPSILSASLAVEMTRKVATVKQPLACLEVSSDSGISAYSKRGTKSMGSPLRVCQVWFFLLFILASSKQVNSSAQAMTEGGEIGTCRFDLTSVATLSCVEPDGNWRPPSVSCCTALLYAIDNLPARNESGACCLCRYASRKYSSHGLALATSYVLCQGKDSHIVKAWSSLPLPCYTVCRRQGNASSYGMGTPILKDFPVGDVGGTQSGYFVMLLWIAIIGAGAFCVVILVRFCYQWRHRPMPLSLQNQGSPSSEIRGEHRPPSGKKLSAHRRMSSSRGSPNG